MLAGRMALLFVLLVASLVAMNGAAAAPGPVSGAVTDRTGLVGNSMLASPASFETRIVTGGDDAEERPGGAMVLTSSDLELTFDGGGPQLVGLRFDGVALPDEATITGAWIQFTVDEVSTEPTDLEIAVEADDAAAPYRTAAGDISSRQLGPERIAWSPPPWPTIKAAGPDQRTPDLSALVRSVVERPGWSSGGVINFVVSGSGERVTESFDGVAGQAPLLRIEFTVPSDAPIVVETTVAGPDDDAEERPSGTVSTRSSDLELTFDVGGHQTVGVRFASVDVPSTAEITDAWIQFTVDEASSDPTDLVVRAEAADAAGAFSTQSGSITSRPLTDAAVGWQPQGWEVVGASGTDQRTPDLSSIVTEVVQRPGWARGQPIAFVITGTGERVAESFDGSQAGAPVLHVEYRPSGNTAPTVEVSTPVPGSVFTVGDPVPLAATAGDAEDGDLSAAIQWSSDRDGPLGTGSALSTAALGIGIHTITASVVDSAGAVAAETLRLSVESTEPFVIGAGDIAECGDDRDEATAALVEFFPSATAITLGDNAYPDGTIDDYQNCYDPSWGAFRDRTRPSVGNHDYFTPGAAGYFSYFGAAAGDPAEGWYSYDLGSWHVVVLNSNCAAAGGCGPNSAQVAWLRADLAANPAECTLAYWHHPQFSSGLAPNGAYDTFWEVLHDAGADIVLNGHSHHYERFARQDPSGSLDPANGIRQFVVGTGGDGLFPVGTIAANSEARIFGVFGVIGLELLDGGYTWEFMPVEGETASDAGADSCVDGSPVEQVGVRISASADDAEERAQGSVLIGSSDLELTFDGGGHQTVGLRFDEIAIPAGSTVVDARIQFAVDETGSEPTSLTIAGLADDDAGPFTATPFDISNRPTTVASIDWDPDPWVSVGDDGDDQRTPDLSTVVQEIVDRSGWQEGAAIGFTVTGTGERVAESFDGSAGRAPLLVIDHLPPPDLRPTLSILTPPTGETTVEGAATSLSAEALDALDGDLSGSVTWRSDRDGVLGTGATLSPILSVGGHRLTASVTDSAGQTTTATIDHTVTLADPPTVVSIAVATGTDDAEERSSGTVFLTSSDLELTFDFGADQVIGLRFDQLPVPEDATITEAWIQFTADEVNTEPTSLSLSIEVADDAAGFDATPFGISSRTQSATRVAWNPGPWLVPGLAGTDQRTPDLSALVQSAVDRTGWVDGNAIVVIISGTGERVAESFEGSATRAPVLHLEFTT